MFVSAVLRFICLSVLLVPLVSCVAVPDFEAMFGPYKSAKLEGQNIKIMAEDKSFEIVPGEFEPPFQTTPMSPIIWTSIYSETLPDGSIYDTSLADSAGHALTYGAKKVRLYHPVVDQPLYGVLLFNQKPVTAIGSAANSYSIQIPEDKIAKVKQGSVQVLYESVDRTDYSINMYAWVLWVSDQPFE